MIQLNITRTSVSLLCLFDELPFCYRISIANVDNISPGREMARMQRAKLQLVILCPAMLAWLEGGTSGGATQATGNGHAEGSLRSSLRRLLRVERTLAMLLGVSESEVTPEHRSGELRVGNPLDANVSWVAYRFSCWHHAMIGALDSLPYHRTHQTPKTGHLLFKQCITDIPSPTLIL